MDPAESEFKYKTRMEMDNRDKQISLQRLRLRILWYKLTNLSKWILDEGLVSDQIEEADTRPVESQDVFRWSQIFQVSINTANLEEKFKY